MTVYATFERAPSQPWTWRIVITGRFEVYMKRRTTAPSSASRVESMVDRFRNAFLNSWNSTSQPITHSGAGYMIHFEFRAIPGGHSPIQSLVDRPRWNRGLETETDRAARANGCTAVVIREAEGTDAYVPWVGSFHRALPRHQHQPWSSMMVVGHRVSEYTLGHETGHILGLGEGYRLYGTYTTVPSGSRVLASARDQTIPEARGTPMATSSDAGRDPNSDQRLAILRYALAARAAGGTGADYGPNVDDYRARTR